MQSVWARQNPGIAYSLGYIDAETYRTLTGKYPVGYSAGGGGGGRRSYGGGYAGGDGDGEVPLPPEETLLDKYINGTYTPGQATGSNGQRSQAPSQNEMRQQVIDNLRAKENDVVRGFGYTNYITNYNVP